jgi:carotenoid cleavage dioxygenase-like enzyme
MAERESDVNPFLRGNFAPFRMEGDAPDLEVVGELPRDLNGTFYRNGPNAAFEPLGRYHWFDGDGMIHAIRLQGGRASYRNRWVKSDGLLEERRAGHSLYPGLLEMSAAEMPSFKNTANTNIVQHAGKLLALMEAALPTRLDPDTLATIGVEDFDGRLASAMTAHPKLDPETGEMLFFGYSPFPPFLQYHIVDASGALARSEVIDVPWPSMIHDFAVTRDEVVFILCPLVFSFEDLGRRGSPFTWEPERGTRLGVMPRRGTSAEVRWFETDASYVFHPMNAYREGDEVVVDVARYDRLLFMSTNASRDPDWQGDGEARLHRWRLDLGRGTIAGRRLDDRPGEFPRVDERRLGRKYRFGYFAARGANDDEAMPIFSAIRKIDVENGTCVTRELGMGNGAGEPLFVPRTDAADEDDGYVICLAYDRAENRSDFLVLEARDIAGPPIATVRLPHRVPYGFHGSWVPLA